MAKKLTFTYFSLKTIAVLHLFVFAITLRHAKTDMVADAQAPTVSFFMHDIIGGSAPSERIVAGTIVDTQTAKLPFSKPNNKIFPFKGAIPLVDTSTATNPTHSSTTMVIKDIDKNKVVIDRNPQGASPDKFLFGRITVIDDEITQGHEFGSEVIGKAQGFHLTSSLDGSSRTMAFTVVFGGEGDDEEDAVSFFGVHRTATKESHIAVVGGTGKYDNAKGYAKIETLPSPQQHTTNGLETLLQITVYIA
ncbi:hypothetical protein LR48_Vigan1242s000700 [Vigna angularis]|uniref:Dirigent protein n=2 Tax=Phaseolus angularis TaxID=3914 RepID=A0A0L9TIT2_PHAAN|nr:dirigent protein 9 [Vigna angularis]KAG2397674.1 Dirigent protein [Vigna angularis]KOM30352.1 hypothetical protein LR48_Vigan1242s000700 [Vigna angularis]BAT90681.1 hypothetical protein VIGAN_06196100 [Vigna angularis var. angularis]